jgi:hypothetical protein
MEKKNRYRIIIFLSALVLLFVIGIFFIRAPVLIVSDQYFNDLYGKNRALFSGIRSSIKLFRQVKLVTVAEDIGPDGIAFAVSQVSENPYIVCFPYRYLDGAQNYQNQFPSINTLLFSGKEKNPDVPKRLGDIQTDTETDLYRAGLAAALISEGKEGKILCYIENRGSREYRSSFEQGLKDGGREGDALFIALNRSYTDNEPVSCIVLTGNSDDSFIIEENIPIILFSWADPNLFSSQVKVIFNDSPWETLIPAIKMFQNANISKDLPEDDSIDSENLTESLNLNVLPSSIKMHSKNDFSAAEKKRLEKAFLQNKPLTN